MANQYGISKGRIIQGGWETTLGTEVVATEIWRGKGMWEDKKAVTFADEDVGYIAGIDRTFIPFLLGALGMDGIPATYEQLPHVLACALKNVISGSADGAGSGKIYTYTAHTLANALNTIKTKTWQVGNNHAVALLPGSFVTDFSLDGKLGEAWTVQANWSANQVTLRQKRGTGIAFINATKKITDTGSGLAQFTTGMMIRVEGSVSNDGVYTVATGGVAGEIVTTEALVEETAGATVRVSQTFTGGLSLVTLEEMLFSKTKLYLDAIGGTIGATQKSGVLLGANLKVNPGWRPRGNGGDGNLYYTAIRAGMPEATLNVTFEHSGEASAEFENYTNQTARLLRLKCEGAALGTAGTTYTYKTMIADLAGKWESFEKIGEQDGNDTVTGVFRARYDGTAAKFFEMVIVNERASIT